MNTEDPLTFERLSSFKGPAFEKLYQIYTASIHVSEQKQRGEIESMCSRADYRILLVKQRDHVVGFSILFAPQNELFFLLEYMAIDPAYRSRGIGTTLCRHSFAEISGENHRNLMLLEVESDFEAGLNQAIRRRRLQFYKRLGCRRIDRLAYLLPLKQNGSPPPMFLLVYEPTGLELIRKADLGNWLGIIYDQVYHCSPTDPRISQMMSTVNDPVEIAP